MNVLSYLCTQLNMRLDEVNQCWDALKEEILSEGPPPAAGHDANSVQLLLVRRPAHFT